MRPVELPVFFVLVVLLLSAPYLPSSVLLLLDGLVARIAMVIVLLYLISQGPTVGIFGFVAFAILLMERNRRKVKRALTKWDALDVHAPAHATVEEAGTPQKTVPVAPFDVPRGEESDYLPQAALRDLPAFGADEPIDVTLFDSDPLGSSSFEPVDSSINEKVVLASSYPVSHQAASSRASMESIYEQLGVGHVRGVETVA